MSPKLKKLGGIALTLSLVGVVSCSQRPYKDYGLFKKMDQSDVNRKIAAEESEEEAELTPEQKEKRRQKIYEKVLRDTNIVASKEFSIFSDPEKKVEDTAEIYRGHSELEVKVQITPDNEIDCFQDGSRGEMDEQGYISFTPGPAERVYCKSNATSAFEKRIKVRFITPKPMVTWKDVEDGRHDKLEVFLETTKKGEYPADAVNYIVDMQGSTVTNKLNPKEGKIALGSVAEGDYIEFVKAEGKIGQGKRGLEHSPILPEGQVKLVRKTKQKDGTTVVIKNYNLPYMQEAPNAVVCVVKSSKDGAGEVIFVGGQVGVQKTGLKGDIECHLNNKNKWTRNQFLGEFQIVTKVINQKQAIEDIQGLLKHDEQVMKELIALKINAQGEKLSKFVKEQVIENGRLQNDARTEMDARARASKRVADAEANARDRIEEETSAVKEENRAVKGDLANEVRKYFPISVAKEFYHYYFTFDFKAEMHTSEYEGEKFHSLKFVFANGKSVYVSPNKKTFEKTENLLGKDYILTKSVDNLQNSLYRARRFIVCPNKIANLSAWIGSASKDGNLRPGNLVDILERYSVKDAQQCHAEASTMVRKIILKPEPGFEFCYKKTSYSKKPAEDVPALDFVGYKPYQIKRFYYSQQYKLGDKLYIDGKARDPKEIAELKRRQIADPSSLTEEDMQTLAVADQVVDLKKTLVHRFFEPTVVKTNILTRKGASEPEMKCIPTDGLFPHVGADGFVKAAK